MTHEHLDPVAASRQTWPATRTEGLRRLAAFAPAMGRVYKTRRNYDLGPGDRANVSLLSPYIRRRLVTEREAVVTALSAHGADKAEKFIQEVFWRTYWKGWLEMRPSVWTAYRHGLAADRARAAEDRGLTKRLAKAEAGATGIDAFDAWAEELAETGYLHNHARMWFASIWIFTLGLPWRLGADLFLRRLLDGDPASNTLGWRWVAGLQTRGKNYVARAANIAKFSGGRFNPVGLLDERATPLPEPADAPPAAAPPRTARPDPDKPAALLLTEEDCAPETMATIASLTPIAVGIAPLSAARSDADVAPAIAEFERSALEDAAARFRADLGPTTSRDLLTGGVGDIAAWAADRGAAQLVTPRAPVGWVRDRLDAERPALDAAGVALVEPLRPWDEAAWPYATAGFFKFKERIPGLIQQLR